jgi:uncharacterized protein YdhG (YjbR/CyaY superfamily)
VTASTSPVDAALALLPPDRRELLEALRRTIHAHVPGLEECISYRLPAFRWKREVIAGFAATAKGGSYYPFSGATLDTLGDALGSRSRTKAALHFDAGDPLSAALVGRLLDTRMAEVLAAASAAPVRRRKT